MTRITIQRRRERKAFHFLPSKVEVHCRKKANVETEGGKGKQQHTQNAFPRIFPRTYHPVFSFPYPSKVMDLSLGLPTFVKGGGKRRVLRTAPNRGGGRNFRARGTVFSQAQKPFEDASQVSSLIFADKRPGKKGALLFAGGTRGEKGKKRRRDRKRHSSSGISSFSVSLLLPLLIAGSLTLRKRTGQETKGTHPRPLLEEKGFAIHFPFLPLLLLIVPPASPKHCEGPTGTTGETGRYIGGMETLHIRNYRQAVQLSEKLSLQTLGMDVLPPLRTL